MFKEKILDGTKTQTIRPWNEKRYEQMIKSGKLQLYWKQRTKECELLKEAELSKIFRIRFVKGPKGVDVLIVSDKEPRWWDHLNLLYSEKEELAVLDGFSSFKEMTDWFYNKYRERMFEIDFMVIRWK